MKRRYNIEVDCANCANKIEDKINRMDEVDSCNINFMVMKMIVTLKDNVNEEDFLEKVNQVARRVDSDSKISKK